MLPFCVRFWDQYLRTKSALTFLGVADTIIQVGSYSILLCSVVYKFVTTNSFNCHDTIAYVTSKMYCKKTWFSHSVYIVGCRGVVQLGGPVPVLWQLVLLRYKACKSILFINDPSVVKIKNTGLTKLTHFIFFHSKIISQFCRNGKDCYWIGDRLYKNYEKLPYLHKISKREF